MRHVIAAIALLIPACLSAQGDVVWSTFLGPSSSRLGTLREDGDWQRGLTLGVGRTHQLSRGIAFDIGVAYGQRGGRMLFEGGGDTKLRLDYLDVPASIRLSDPVFLRLGLAYSTQLHCAVAEEAGFNRVPDSTSGGTSTAAPVHFACKRLRQTDIGPIAGIGVLLRSGPVQLTLEMRQSVGLKLSSAESGADARSRSTAFLLGFGFVER